MLRLGPTTTSRRGRSFDVVQDFLPRGPRFRHVLVARLDAILGAWKGE